MVTVDYRGGGGGGGKGGKHCHLLHRCGGEIQVVKMNSRQILRFNDQIELLSPVGHYFKRLVISLAVGCSSGVTLPVGAPAKNFWPPPKIFSVPKK